MEKGFFETKKMAHGAVKTVFETCPLHGEYIVARADADGFLRYFPNQSCPICTRLARAQKMIGNALIPPRFESKSFEDFVVKNKGQAEALKASRNFVERFDSVRLRGSNLIFSGRPGTGKTHLACAIANALCEKGYACLFTTVPEIIRRIRSAWTTKGQSEESVIDSLAALDLLILDEVGLQYGTDSEKNTLFQVINARYVKVKPTIFISNLRLTGEDSMENFLGQRVFDRLREDGSESVVFDWESWRKGAA